MTEANGSPTISSPATPAGLFLMTATVCAIAALLVRQFNSPDIWWQIAIGRNIIDTMAVPHLDHFSAAGWGRSYHDSHWLFQIVLAIADRIGGTDAVGVIPVAIWSAAFICCYRSIRRWLSPSASCLLLFVVAVSCNYRFTPRPEIITCLMITLYYLLLQARKYTKFSELALFAVLQVIWSNSHGLFVIGPFMAGSYLAEAAWRKMRHEQSELLHCTKLLAILLAASLCTPFGMNGWSYALQIAGEAGPSAHEIYKNLEELRPTFSSGMLPHPEFWGFSLLLAASVVGVFSLAARRQLSNSRLLIIIALLATAATGRRNIPLFTLTAAPFIAETCRDLLPRFRRPDLYKTALGLGLIAFTWFPLSGRYYQWFHYEPLRFGIGVPTGAQPAGLPEFLRQTGFSGQLYNNDLFGGFCLYHGILPLVDGRWEVYDQEELSTILRAPFDPSAWESVVTRYGITGALLQNGVVETRTLAARFFADGSFKLVYQDTAASFWLRTTTPAP